MPIVSGTGQIIDELDPADPFVEYTKKIRLLRYPRDVRSIMHLSYQQFGYWLYGLDPKQALYLTNTREFRILQETMRKKTWLTNLYDWAWRRWHGFDF